MQPLVQSAIDAANRGENNKAMEFIKQALAANPNDVDAWLVVAAIVEQPERKRQCLNRVLSLDPTNQIARDELLEMDRAAMGGTPLFTPEPVADTRQGATPKPQSVYQPAPPPPSYPTSTSAFESEPAPSQAQAQVAPRPSSKTRTEKPLVFKYPLFWRILVYVFMAIFGCIGLLALQDVSAAIVPCGLFLLLVPVVWIISPVVEVSDSGIKVYRMFGTSQKQVAWDHVSRIKANTMGQGMELVTDKGTTVNVTSQVSGYPAIVESLRRKRPDLFNLAAVPASSGGASGNSSSTISFTGTKTFQKNLFAQYGAFLLLTPLCLFAIWAVVSEKQYFVGIGVALVALFFMAMALFAVNAVKVESNKLTTQSLFGEKEFTTRQIKNITMKTVRSRHGVATNFIHVELVEGSAFSLSGFSEGNEVMYGFLMNWWNTYGNK